jgi:hypothetical protein
MKEILLPSNFEKLPWNKKYFKVPPCRIFKILKIKIKLALHLMRLALQTCPFLSHLRSPCSACPAYRACPPLTHTHPLPAVHALLSPLCPHPTGRGFYPPILELTPPLFVPLNLMLAP